MEQFLEIRIAICQFMQLINFWDNKFVYTSLIDLLAFKDRLQKQLCSALYNIEYLNIMTVVYNKNSIFS